MRNALRVAVPRAGPLPPPRASRTYEPRWSARSARPLSVIVTRPRPDVDRTAVRTGAPPRARRTRSRTTFAPAPTRMLTRRAWPRSTATDRPRTAGRAGEATCDPATPRLGTRIGNTNGTCWMIVVVFGPDAGATGAAATNVNRNAA